ncbi:MAG: hypothetical protein WCC70_12400 [Candidatus Aquilonibacter sp.]
MRSLSLCFLFVTAFALAACGGSTVIYVTPSPQPTNQPTGQPTGQPSTTPSSTVSFNVIVPNISGNARRRPNVVVPAASLSVAIQLDSVNSVPTSLPPTIVNLSASSSGCEQTSTQLSCVVNVSAPVASLVYTLTVYSAANGTGTSLGAGNLAVTTTAGATVVAPATLTGTAAKIVVTAGGAALGVSITVPVTVQAEDANGNTLLGTYTNPITLSDSDASGQTALSPSATNIMNGATAITLAYAGGSMASPATINASAANVSPSNVTAGSFSPSQTYPSLNGSSTSFTSTGTYMFGNNGPPNIGPDTSSGNYDAVVSTGQSFNGVNNLVEIAGLNTATNWLPSSFATTINFQNLIAYYAWTPQGTNASLGLVGMTSDTGFTLTCESPYTKEIEAPLTTDWNVLSGSAPCTASYNDGRGDTGETILNPDGSYVDNTQGLAIGEIYTIAVNSDGSMSQTTNENCGCGSSIVSVGVPSPGASLIPVEIQTFPGAIPPLGQSPTPSPEPTSVPNPWAVWNGIPGEQIPNPLESDTFVVVGPIGSLPSECAIPAGLLGSNPTLSEADETVIVADPASDWNAMYYSNQTIKHYYLDGVGEICNENVYIGASYNAYPLNYYLNVPSNPNFNTSVTTVSGTQWTYLTATTLTATSARRRESAQAFTAATYALFHAPLHIHIAGKRRV